MIYLKKADKSAASNALEAQKVVHDMLANIDKDGEQAVRNYAEKLDGWSGEILLVSKFMSLQKLSVTL